MLHEHSKRMLRSSNHRSITRFNVAMNCLMAPGFESDAPSTKRNSTLMAGEGVTAVKVQKRFLTLSIWTSQSQNRVNYVSCHLQCVFFFFLFGSFFSQCNNCARVLHSILGLPNWQRRLITFDSLRMFSSQWIWSFDSWCFQKKALLVLKHGVRGRIYRRRMLRTFE